MVFGSYNKVPEEEKDICRMLVVDFLKPAKKSAKEIAMAELEKIVRDKLYPPRLVPVKFKRYEDVCS